MASRMRVMSITVAALVGAPTHVAYGAVKTIDPHPVMVLTGYSEALKFSGPSGLFIDRKRGDIWVADTGNHQIVGFDAKGVPLLRFRHMAIDPATGEASPGSPLSLAVDSLGQVFVSDGVSNKVAMYDYRGRLIKRIDVAKILGVERAKPRCLDVDANDNLYVVDDTSQLIVLSADQELLRAISLKRSATGAVTQTVNRDGEKFIESISAMDIGNDGKIYLLNSTDYPCVRVLDSTGKELLAFGDIAEEWFRRPFDIASADDGTFWIADCGTHRVKQFTSDGKYQQYIGGGPGSRPGEMRNPAALATDGQGKLYVAERGTNRIQVFSLKS
ncbi:MAG: NHL repeat-containing protein [Armatimonadota bacterium]|nr:NHL repeat-containing protein [Armatimonadota bacterium]